LEFFNIPLGFGEEDEEVPDDDEELLAEKLVFEFAELLSGGM